MNSTVIQRQFYELSIMCIQTLWNLLSGLLLPSLYLHFLIHLSILAIAFAIPLFTCAHANKRTYLPTIPVFPINYRKMTQNTSIPGFLNTYQLPSTPDVANSYYSSFHNNASAACQQPAASWCWLLSAGA